MTMGATASATPNDHVDVNKSVKQEEDSHIQHLTALEYPQHDEMEGHSESNDRPAPASVPKGRAADGAAEAEAENLNQPTNIPVVPHYIFRETTANDLPSQAGKDFQGRKDYAVFATEAIPAGTRIISEEALTMIHVDPQRTDLMRQNILGLSTRDQERFWRLNPAPLKVTRALEELALSFGTVQALGRLHPILLKNKSKRAKLETRQLKEEGPSIEREIIRIRAGLRVLRNGVFFLDGPSSPNTANEGVAQHRVGIFIESAGLRYSCVPNCLLSHNELTKRLNVHTICNIAKGEELTLSKDDGVYMNSAEARKAMLWNKYGIWCSCEACVPTGDGKKFRMHERRRKDIKTRWLRLDELFGNFWKPNKDYGQIGIFSQLEIGECETERCELVGSLIATAGRWNMELVGWYKTAVNKIALRLLSLSGDEKNQNTLWGIMEINALKCERTAKMCLGEDNLEYFRCRGLKEKVKRQKKDWDERGIVPEWW